MLRLESVKGQNRAHMVALVCLCQTRRTLKTSWRAVPGELVGTLSDAFPKLCL